MKEEEGGNGTAPYEHGFSRNDSQSSSQGRSHQSTPPAATRVCCSFAGSRNRKMYAFYARRTRYESPKLYVFVSLLTSVRYLTTAVMAYDSKLLAFVVMSSVLLVCGVMSLIVYSVLRSKDRVVSLMTYYGFLSALVQLLLSLILHEQSSVTLSDGLDWNLFLVYAIFVLAPVFLYKCVVMAMVSIILQLVASSILASRHGDIYTTARMVTSQCFLYLAACILGGVTHSCLDCDVRESFIESKASLSVSLQIQESSKEQERLLLSVLPRHVAREMISDLGEEISGQFRKIYMNRHEDVSILFADIVGFTALSSIVTSAELVKILNDLFAEFDKLAQKFRQLRIKILGDCYYCICGCPDPRPDHAVLCIHMGLAMVDAITQVRERTQSGVNMRVGIHTGAVLGGVLGQRRWQYDIFGHEVTLANKMESGGLPGRVHISDTTAQCLNGEFELEPGCGDTREEAIREAGVQTYLIQRVVKQYPSGTLDDTRRESDHSEASTEDTVQSVSDNWEKLETALINREHKTHMSEKLSFLTQHFNDATLEQNYCSATNRTKIWRNIAAMATSTWLCLAALTVVNKMNIWVITAMVSGSVVLTGVAVISYCFSKSAIKTDGLRSSLDQYIVHTRVGQIMWAVMTSSVLLITGFLSAFGCSFVANPTLNHNISMEALETVGCLYPQYFPCVGVLVMMAVTSLSDIEYLVKSVVCLIVMLCWVILNQLLMTSSFDFYDSWSRGGFPPVSMDIPFRHSSSVSLILISIGCVAINRHLGRLSRKLFVYQTAISDMQAQVQTLKAKNQALIYNILPAHVAGDFIGVKRNDEELYSHAYDSVGVMFASCPNFNDFYTEQAINNNGLECIRFLNEILSDYDDLLESPKFHNITKIKTIGPTYMAASGMQGTHSASGSSEDSVITRWQHLADLVEFAMAMKTALDRINVQSFNHFMLRVGLNHGPVLAGVIGAKKPHYDIWGNTVNVASRMDSTGHLGKIQVVESTMEILCHFGYTFEKRGLIKVKGKGDLMTYFLTGREPVATSSHKGHNVSLPNQVD